MPDPVPLMADRRGLPHRPPEAELVLVDVRDDCVALVLDDGETLTFDARELRTALGEAA